MQYNANTIDQLNMFSGIDIAKKKLRHSLTVHLQLVLVQTKKVVYISSGVLYIERFKDLIVDARLCAPPTIHGS